jgi:hypothetical protein
LARKRDHLVNDVRRRRRAVSSVGGHQLPDGLDNSCSSHAMLPGELAPPFKCFVGNLGVKPVETTRHEGLALAQASRRLTCTDLRRDAVRGLQAQALANAAVLARISLSNSCRSSLRGLRETMLPGRLVNVFTIPPRAAGLNNNGCARRSTPSIASVIDTPRRFGREPTRSPSPQPRAERLRER